MLYFRQSGKEAPDTLLFHLTMRKCITKCYTVSNQPTIRYTLSLKYNCSTFHKKSIPGSICFHFATRFLFASQLLRCHYRHASLSQCSHPGSRLVRPCPGPVPTHSIVLDASFRSEPRPSAPPPERPVLLVDRALRRPGRVPGSNEATPFSDLPAPHAHALSKN